MFWKYVNECLRNFERGSKIVLTGEMNGRVGSYEIAGVAGKWGIDRVNENGEDLVDVCAERRLPLAHTFFQHRWIHRQRWRRRDKRGEQKSMIGYIAVDERLKKDVLDVKVVRGMFDVVAKMQVRVRWEYGKKCKRKGQTGDS